MRRKRGLIEEFRNGFAGKRRLFDASYDNPSAGSFSEGDENNLTRSKILGALVS